jgi:hypothetical protein
MRISSRQPEVARGRWSFRRGRAGTSIPRDAERWFSAGVPTQLVRDGTVEGHDPLGDNERGVEPSYRPEPVEPPSDEPGPVAWWDAKPSTEPPDIFLLPGGRMQVPHDDRPSRWANVPLWAFMVPLGLLLMVVVIALLQWGR